MGGAYSLSIVQLVSSEVLGAEKEIKRFSCDTSG